MSSFMDRESELFVREICFDGEFSRYIVLVYLSCIRVEVRIDVGKMVAIAPFNHDFILTELSENVEVEGYRVRYDKAFNANCSDHSNNMQLWFQIPMDEVYTCQACGKQSAGVSAGWCSDCKSIYRRAIEQLHTEQERIIFSRVLEELSQESALKFYRIVRLPEGYFYSSRSRSVWVKQRHAEQALELALEPEKLQIVEYVAVTRAIRDFVSCSLQKKAEAR
jgi:Zn finger protein HypA/HybF involved in hydrogenase expression